MRRDYRLLFGLFGATLFFVGTAQLARMVPGYSQVRQTVSEIGEVGSPARIPFAILMCCVAGCILVFATAVRDVSLQTGHSGFAAYLIASMAVSSAGAGVFAYPHPLHNIFGMSELIAYQAPLFLALSWRNDKRLRALVTFSWIMFFFMWISIVLNLSWVNRHSTFAGFRAMGDFVAPAYGLVQRSLFAAWFGWCAATGLLLLGRRFTKSTTEGRSHEEPKPLAADVR